MATSPFDWSAYNPSNNTYKGLSGDGAYGSWWNANSESLQGKTTPWGTTITNDFSTMNPTGQDGNGFDLYGQNLRWNAGSDNTGWDSGDGGGSQPGTGNSDPFLSLHSPYARHNLAGLNSAYKDIIPYLRGEDLISWDDDWGVIAKDAKSQTRIAEMMNMLKLRGRGDWEMFRENGLPVFATVLTAGLASGAMGGAAAAADAGAASGGIGGGVGAGGAGGGGLAASGGGLTGWGGGLSTAAGWGPGAAYGGLGAELAGTFGATASAGAPTLGSALSAASGFGGSLGAAGWAAMPEIANTVLGAGGAAGAAGNSFNSLGLGSGLPEGNMLGSEIYDLGANLGQISQKEQILNSLAGNANYGNGFTSLNGNYDLMAKIANQMMPGVGNGSYNPFSLEQIAKSGLNYVLQNKLGKDQLEAASKAGGMNSALNQQQRFPYQNQLSQLMNNPASFWQTNPVAQGQLQLASDKFQAQSAKMGTGGTQFTDYLNNVMSAANGTFNDQAKLLAMLGGYDQGPGGGGNIYGQLAGQGNVYDAMKYKGIFDMLGSSQAGNDRRGNTGGGIINSITQSLLQMLA